MDHPDIEINPPDWFRESSWLGFIDWASKKESLIAQFEEETGKHIVPAGKSVLEAMIDRACGVEESNIQTMKDFVVWVTKKYWGPDEDCPEVYFRLFKANS